MKARTLVLAVIMLSLTRFAAARDYYISPRGNDAGQGTMASPWATVRMVNSTVFQGGDKVLFESGARYSGTVTLKQCQGSGPGNRILIGTYGGTESATIDGGKTGALVLSGCRHVRIARLSLVGSGRKEGNNANGGLIVRESKDVEIDSVSVSGFRGSGILLDGVDSVRITRVHAFENGFAGISSGGALSHNIYIGYSLAENNPGDPSVRNNHSGNGIVVGYARGAIIEYCEARYNGWDMPWTGNGPVGIWTYESADVTIQFCVAHHNRSTAQDGGGFDFDGGVTNSRLQYNYSHDNYGAGYLICQYAGAGRFAANTVRFNISQDDGLKDHDAGIYVWVGGPGMEGTTVYNNTIVNSKGSAVAFGSDKQYQGPGPDMRFYNNIFVSRGPVVRGASAGKFAGNLYWAVGERGFDVDGYKDFAEWVRATGQETIREQMVGVYADPMLRRDGPALLSAPALLRTLHEFRLKPGSPAAGTGVDLGTAFDIDPGSRDFFGNSLVHSGRPNRGADASLPAAIVGARQAQRPAGAGR